MAARNFAFISGILYILVGIAGFIPTFVGVPAVAPDLAVNAGFGYLFGLFPINVLHNLVHLGVGAWGLASYSDPGRSRTYCQGLTIFYGLLAVMGLIPVLRTTFGLIPIYSHDIWLHALTALIAGVIGFAIPNNYASKVEDRIATGSGTRDR